ncbi:MAG: hypothetical protein ACRYGA_15955 [Janthinobacterium lividum]
MNRCKDVPRRRALRLFVCLFGLAPLAQAQSAAELARTATQNEAAVGGRSFPIGTLRGRLLVVDAPEIRLDDKADRMAPGTRIRNAQNMLVTPASVTGQLLAVNYARDVSNLVSQVWILSEAEAATARVSAEKPFLNFWPFVRSTGTGTDDGS